MSLQTVRDAPGVAVEKAAPPSSGMDQRAFDAHQICDAHGASLLLLAGLLLDDREAAEAVVTQTIVDAARGADGALAGSLRHSLSRRVFVRCTRHPQEWGAPAGRAGGPLSSNSALSPTMAALRTLSEQQRAALGLVLFGHHTYREVADLLSLPAATVLGMLRSGLQEMRP